MGTDRDEIARGPCPCGKGIIVVDRCSPDHPWGGNAWHEAGLQCTDCVKEFQVVSNHEGPRLVRITDLQNQQALGEKVREKVVEIEQSAEFKHLKSIVESGLSTCRSLAAQHRFLEGAGLTTQSYQSYRRSPHYYLTPHNASRIANALQVSSPNLERMTTDLERRRDAANADVPSVDTGIRYLR